jgi:hypothetical protein
MATEPSRASRANELRNLRKWFVGEVWPAGQRNFRDKWENGSIVRTRWSRGAYPPTKGTTNAEVFKHRNPDHAGLPEYRNSLNSARSPGGPRASLG